MATLYQDYTNGRHQEVWSTIHTLGEEAFETKYIDDIKAVVKETMLRVSYNLDLIYHRLQNYNFQFENAVRMPPDEETEIRLDTLQSIIHQKGGHLPLSLIEFYRTVGSVNFVWKWESTPPHWYIPGIIDPLVMEDLSIILDLSQNIDWFDFNNPCQTYPEKRFALDLCPDAYHKDNISGAGTYGIEISKKPCTDTLFLDREHEYCIYFVDYLRLCFQFGGFPGLISVDGPTHSTIEYLREDLKEI